ncbi:glycosyltransferase [Clostridium novyi]
MRKIAIVLIGEIKFDGRVQKEIRTLRNKGFQVSLIVSRFQNDEKYNYDFDIFHFDYKIEKSPLKNLINKFAFCKNIQNILRKIKPDVIHCNDLETLYSGVLYKKYNKNIKIVYDAHELYPESQHGIVRKVFWNVIEKRFIKYANIVISPEKNRAKYMKKKYNLEKVNVIENFPCKVNIDNINYVENMVPCIKNKFKVLYIGIISPNREIEKMITAMKYLDEKYCLLLVGKVSSKKYREKLQQIIIENDLSKKVYFIGPVKNNEVINYINHCDLGLVFYKDSNLNNYYCASNKLYEFIVCRKPVITNDYPGLIEVIRNKNLGICLSEINDLKLKDAIEKLKDVNIDKRADIDEYFWEKNESKLSNLYF